ncbi:hypothetical protein TGDOM2_258140 [Toxoplasma gondii GAB2-2007-GAL-DOM2]|uniref:Uncharacterized protein n=5 Tax=Toxoplasma gondii TaxID=5811 RepID=A0A086K0Q2_TOXGO|nr:hypothetical protein TGP89_258140 [Toxoplasma gondii p89]KFG33782.1 hypothetical protein TGDOM2_258140 [Toxoplasma gondii GAB2-2007-GAL-DOM2]KFG37970.1 hypothetical protein TGFOU_258140 [Toxoplasma gondii FOU]PUA84236.1 hypothetical protein TGBR9_258140 [Toxoplasma gondii TgCATBr9]RQX71109.1 hypothetical protein TGCAST_258140 [Toxoplasma gondii CAST]
MRKSEDPVVHRQKLPSFFNAFLIIARTNFYPHRLTVFAKPCLSRLAYRSRTGEASCSDGHAARLSRFRAGECFRGDRPRKLEIHVEDRCDLSFKTSSSPFYRKLLLSSAACVSRLSSASQSALHTSIELSKKLLTGNSPRVAGKKPNANAPLRTNASQPSVGLSTVQNPNASLACGRREVKM